MKSFNSISLKQIFAGMLAIVVMFVFDSCKKASEKTGEKLIETAIGDHANVDMSDDKIVIRTDEGTFTSDATIKSWPKEIPKDVPEFTEGTIANLSTQTIEDSFGWIFIFEDVSKSAPEDYKKLLKDKGFKVSSLNFTEGQGQITAEKDKTIVAMMFGDDMATLNVSIEK